MTTTATSYYYQLLDEVNAATSQSEHDILASRLNGYRKALNDLGVGWSGIDDDIHTMGKYGRDANMCCGVLFRPTEQS